MLTSFELPRFLYIASGRLVFNGADAGLDEEVSVPHDTFDVSFNIDKGCLLLKDAVVVKVGLSGLDLGKAYKSECLEGDVSLLVLFLSDALLGSDESSGISVYC